MLFGSPFENCRVLVVEDVAAQALALEQSLQRLGCAVLGPVGSKAEAARLIRRQRPRLALLDMLLLDGGAVPLARQLAALDVPFAAITGQDRDLFDHPLLRGMPRLRKPYSLPQLRACVRQLYRFGLTKALARADQHITAVWEKIEGQTRTVNRLAAKGHDVWAAEELLQAHEQALAVLGETRDGILRELERHGGPADFPAWPGPALTSCMVSRSDLAIVRRWQAWGGARCASTRRARYKRSGVPGRRPRGGPGQPQRVGHD